MKFPSRLALTVLVAGLSLPAILSWSAPAQAVKSGKLGKSTKSQAKAKKVTPAQAAALAAAEADSLSRVDSLIRFAPVRVLDSLLHLDSLRRLHPLRGRDSIAGTRVDSARRADSTKVAVADSTRKADSTALSNRTWFVARPRDFSQSAGFTVQLQERLALELRRSGRVRLASALDTNSTFDGTWKAARASGASKMLYTAIYGGPEGSRNAMVWIFDLADGHKLDSAHGEVRDGSDRAANGLARALVGVLRPPLKDSACQADSLAFSRQTWAVAEPRNWTSDSTAARTVRDSLVSALGRSKLASWKALVVADSCRKRHCTDSAAAAAGIDRVAHSTLVRLADSTWVLSLWVARTVDDSLTDSFRVADANPARLGERTMKELLPRPASCSRCAVSDSRTVWSFAVSGDTSSRGAIRALTGALGKALRARTDRQFLSIPASLPSDSTSRDSVARALGVRRLAVASLSGNDSLRVLRVRIHDLRTGAEDTLLLRRGGPAARVLPWFARHLAAFDSGTASCTNLCREDSLKATNASWAVMRPTGLDTTVDGIVADRLLESFLRQKRGKIISLPEKLPCTDMPCLDSLAATLATQKVLWPQVARKKDSLWTLSARVSDVGSDEWTDSAEIRDTGALEAISGMTSRLWGKINPVRGACDSCVSRDTLEDALAIALPAWGGPGDSLKGAFRDSLAKILSHDGSYQVLDLHAVDSLSGDLDSNALSRLRCRLGAAYVLRSGAALEKGGWRVKASVVEISTGKTIAAVETLDKNSWPGRPGELAPWAARKLLGTDSTLTPPKSNHSQGGPWGRILLLVVPLGIGIGSVVYHW